MNCIDLTVFTAQPNKEITFEIVKLPLTLFMPKVQTRSMNIYWQTEASCQVYDCQLLLWLLPFHSCQTDWEA